MPKIPLKEHVARTMTVAVACLLLAGSWVPARGRVISYPAPADALASARYQLSVNGHSVFVYDAQLALPRSCAYASFELDPGDTANVVVTVLPGFQSVALRPQSAGVTSRTVHGSVHLALTRPKKLALTFDGNMDNPLFIFANPKEAHVPDPLAPGVRYIGPGRHALGEVVLQSNETLYLAGGAVVTGHFVVRNASNVTIRGRGIVDAHGAAAGLLEVRNSSNVSVEGITMVDEPSMHWTLAFYNSSNIRVDNIKELNGERWSNDGCNFISCNKALITNSFIKTDDDCICVKAKGGQDVRSITATNCFLWDTWAHALQIGPELNAQRVSDVNFKNMDIVELAPANGGNYYGAIGIYNSDDATVAGVSYDDIRVELFGSAPRLLDFRIAPSKWSTAPGRGQINGVKVKNLRLTSAASPVWDAEILGWDESHLVQNVSFFNLQTPGGSRPADAVTAHIETNPFVRNLKFSLEN